MIYVVIYALLLLIEKLVFLKNSGGFIISLIKRFFKSNVT